MAERKQKSHLTELLDDVEKSHKSEIRLYVSGHLNHNKLFKPPKSAKYNYWKSSKKPTLPSAKEDALGGPHEMLEKVSSSKHVPPVPIRAKSASPLGYQSAVHPASFRTPVSVSLNTAAFKLQKKEAPEKPEDEAGAFPKQLIREELDIPEMRLLKYRRLKSSRLCVTKEFKDEYRFLPSYLAGVTKKDQYNKFMQVQKEYVAKQDLLENDFIGSKSTERHEKKLAQALQNICDCKRPHFYRLQAIGQVFEDICNSSLIFGDILKEVKNEYELYMVILLDSLPSMQYRTLQEQVKGMKKRMVMTHEIEENRQTIQDLVQKSKLALAKNEELRNKLEIELWVSQTDKGAREKEEGDKSALETTSVASAELLTSLRCQIIMKWEEIQAIEKEIKNTMTFSGIINIKQKTVKELEAEASKLEASNKFLKIQIRDAEYSIRAALRRQKLNEASQGYLWQLVRDFLQPLGEDIVQNTLGLFSQPSFHL
ncbi:uncharacterized protein C6orf118 homolog [Ahaetulla prasina]|uniref:uncharacterized protein C6orf118 homolog n=1 Tax=Ahaetulla prasina TaxID=499056 RepID=UPI0026490C91|nr:uncharacterized protein C6orf118 homolog [Ahaetulla prasina]XP_058024015.1 uncharacterized protein C6orf118 homolog [Ahaetulla prasina]